MSRTHKSDSRGTTGQRSHWQTLAVPFTPEFDKTLTKSSPHFGSLSHHSFFSRHNPHPHRVRHIQGLNGIPVCMVRDDWFVTSSLYPHPLLKSHVLRKAANSSFAFPPALTHCSVSNNNRSALFSEAWRDELKDFVAKVSTSSKAHKDNKEAPPEHEPVRRKTQYSVETGRIIPSSSKSCQRRSHPQRLAYRQPIHDQDLMVLELLCQILQTDSLSSVQHWLLLAGQREKNLVIGMLRHALEGFDLSGQHQRIFPQLLVGAPTCGQPQRVSSNRVNLKSDYDKPVKIGEAEVLAIHAEDDNQI